MITIRPATARGATRTNWLDSRHTFSFGDYLDPAHMGFGVLRVINDDRVEPARGFGMHGHADMEIISYVVEGALAHRDSTGSAGVVIAGEVQRMTAGSGVRHGEMNPSENTPVHFLQIWITPERRGLPPDYQQASFPERAKRGHLLLIASRDGRQGSLTVHQDVDLHAGILAEGQRAALELAPGRRAWIQVARGTVQVNGSHTLSEGDGAAVEEDLRIELQGVGHEAEVLVFDLA